MANYLCKNFAECTKADSREEIDLPAGSETKCPECGVELHEAAAAANDRPGKSKVPLLAAIAALFLAGSGAGAWFYTTKVTPSEPLAMAKPTATAGLAPADDRLREQKKLVDAKITSDAPAAATSEIQKKVIAQEFVKAAIPLMQAGDWAAADKQLERAREASPDEPLVYINQAIVQLKRSRPQEALKLLETAFEKGFRDFKTLESDVDLKKFTSESSYRALAARYQSK